MWKELGRFKDRQPIEVRDETVASLFILRLDSSVPFAHPAGDCGPSMYQIWVLSFYCLFFLDFQRRRHIILFLMRDINNSAAANFK